MFHKIFSIISSIFFDIPSSGSQEDIFEYQDLTLHYHEEIESCMLDGIYVGSRYHNIVDMIEWYKYRSDRQYVSIFGDILAKIIDRSISIRSKDDIGIVSVPMHWSRYIIRWFDHTDLLSQYVAKQVSLPVFLPLGAKISKRQSKLSKKDRLSNRNSAFYIKNEILLPDTIILIDDIISTGSTLQSCAILLKQMWVKRVYAMCIASNQ